MQSRWNKAAGLTKSVVQFTVNGKPEAGAVGRTSPPWAKMAKVRFNSASTSSTVAMDGARTSRLKRTLPGTVLTLPGERVRMPVEARARCLAATWFEWVIIFDARRMASARAEKGVVPV